MLYIKPDYYDLFQCTADHCEDTCCAGWQIVIDKEALARYKKFKGPYRHTLHRGINWRQKCFRQDKQKRCAFLNDKNLCDMYLACGDGIFCRTCDQYPRHTEEFEGVREISLSVSCPEVARMLMARKEPVKFLQEETEEEETCKDFEDMDFDVLLYDLLCEGREEMLEILKNRNLSLDLRLELVLHIADEMQEALDDGAIFTCQDIFRKYEGFRQSADTEDHSGQSMQANADQCSNRPAPISSIMPGSSIAPDSSIAPASSIMPGSSIAPDSSITLPFRRRRLKKDMVMEFSKRVFTGLFHLERLREEWEFCLTESAAALFLDGDDAYDKATEAFEAWIKKNADNAEEQSAAGEVSSNITEPEPDGHDTGSYVMPGPDLTIAMEQLAVYFIFTYFCGAVYNDNILVKVQASVLCVYAIQELLKARWIMNEGTLSQDELYEIVYRFSRELEHSDENLNLTEKIAAKLFPV